MSSILKVDTIQTAAGGTPTAADLGLNVSGSVLQVVTNSSNPIQFSSASGAEVIRASITKKSTSTVFVQTNGVWGDDGNPFHARFYLQRSTDGGTTWSDPDALAWYDGTYTFGNYQGNSASNLHNFHYTYEDITSATNVIYRLVTEGNNAGYTMNVGRRGEAGLFGQKTKITLMEIAG